MINKIAKIIYKLTYTRYLVTYSSILKKSLEPVLTSMIVDAKGKITAKIIQEWQDEYKKTYENYCEYVCVLGFQKLKF
jgi:hypothetical protein